MNVSQLDEFCQANAVLCANDEFWKALFEYQFPQLYAFALDAYVPDVEAPKKYRDRRKFLPWSTLYSEFMALASQPDLLARVEAVINQEATGTQMKELVAELRRTYHAVNYVIAEANLYYKTLLITADSHYLQGARIDDDLMMIMVKSGNVEGVRLLLADPRTAEAVYDQELLKAVNRENLTIVQLLLESGLANPSAFDNAAIMTPDNVEITKLLLADERVDPSANDNAAFYYARTRGNEEVVRLLLQQPEVLETLPQEEYYEEPSYYDEY